MSKQLKTSTDNKALWRPNTTGRNPIALSTVTFTRNRTYFEVTIEQLGEWVGVGVSESQIDLDGSNQILGSHSSCFNSSYFFQGKGYLNTIGNPTQDLPVRLDETN